ncbi:MAG TPA: ABC transporter permease [Bdellovibrionales bacterium]|nr:ABC transporter permease [Bdellovibrionales bacterium]
MLKFVIRRVLYMVPILFGVTLVTFVLFNVAGGDPAAQAAGRYASAAQIQQMRVQMGLDKPLIYQYFDLVKQLFTFDFGRSWSSKQQISTLIINGIGPSLTVTMPGFLLSLLITIPLSLLLAHKRNSFFDKSTMVTCLALISLSSVVYILVGQYFFAYHLGWFPISGWDPSWDGRWEYAALPILIVVALSLGSYILFFRTVFLDEMFQDYVRTARSKGLSNSKILLKHVLRNALIPIITLVVLQVPFLIVGSLLIESFFGIPGLGGLIYQAIQEADFPVIKAMTIVGAILYMIFQVISDVLYAVVDPKIRLG